MKLLLLKLLLTALVTVALALPFFIPSMGSGMLEELQRLGGFNATVLITVFLLLVYFYCKDLQRVLTLIKPKNRAAKPNSVWLMFLIPYNFIEDFFIVYSVSKSLSNNEQRSIKYRINEDFGLLSGLGWCAAQILSLLPGIAGQLAGLLALVLWIIHWRFIRTCIRKLNLTC